MGFAEALGHELNYKGSIMKRPLSWNQEDEFNDLPSDH